MSADRAGLVEPRGSWHELIATPAGEAAKRDCVTGGEKACAGSEDKGPAIMEDMVAGPLFR